MMRDESACDADEAIPNVSLDEDYFEHELEFLFPAHLGARACAQESDLNFCPFLV